MTGSSKSGGGSRPTKSSSEWCPWIEDPDEPLPLMTDEEIAAATKKAVAWMAKQRSKGDESP